MKGTFFFSSIFWYAQSCGFSRKASMFPCASFLSQPSCAMYFKTACSYVSALTMRWKKGTGPAR